MLVAKDVIEVEYLTFILLRFTNNSCFIQSVFLRFKSDMEQLILVKSRKDFNEILEN